MKKTVLALAAMAFVGAAYAGGPDITVSGGRDYLTKTDVNSGTVAVSVPVALPLVGEVALGAEYSQTNSVKGVTLYSYTATVTKNVLKLGPVDLGVKATAGVLDPSNAASGGQLGVGAVAALPINKTFAVVGAVEQRWGQDRVNQANGTLVSAGLRVKF